MTETAVQIQPVTIGKKTKTPKLKTIVRITEFKGKSYVDARQCFQNDKEEWVATKKGISVRFDQLSEFITLMEKAESTIQKGS